ncbi:hypothetical protein PTKIN_Ptkin16aG0538700 [Pterospermum kingtungense]
MEKSFLKKQRIFQIEFLLCIFIPTFLSISIKLAFALALGNETEKLALLALKGQLAGGSPGALNSWNDSFHFCDWEGVRCALKLVGLKLAGIISPSIRSLTFPREAIFFDNILKGNIPMEFGHLRRLRFLNLSHNNLQGQLPVELTNCSTYKCSI